MDASQQAICESTYPIGEMKSNCLGVTRSSGATDGVPSILGGSSPSLLSSSSSTVCEELLEGCGSGIDLDWSTFKACDGLGPNQLEYRANALLDSGTESGLAAWRALTG